MTPLHVRSHVEPEPVEGMKVCRYTLPGQRGDRSVVYIQHPLRDGCWICCPICDSDAHLCPRCYLPTSHTEPTCSNCNDEEN